MFCYLFILLCSIFSHLPHLCCLLYTRRLLLLHNSYLRGSNTVLTPILLHRFLTGA
ncbi:hypothetical protein ABFS83_07G077000 [Erythranthe nasuta]